MLANTERLFPSLWIEGGARVYLFEPESARAGFAAWSERKKRFKSCKRWARVSVYLFNKVEDGKVVTHLLVRVIPITA